MSQRLPPRETLTVEFKSDLKKLPDRELIEALVCLANAEGGELWLGVEDDGTPTGLHAEHRLLEGLAGMVAARTSPSLNVQVEAGGVTVARIRVPKAQGEVATAAGVYLRRRLRHDGTPECAPMLPHERISRASSFGLIDMSAQPVAGASLADLLVTEPRPRNRTLADAMKRVGVVERSGRGVDTIFRGMLKFGRSSPDYSRTDAHSVVLRLLTEPADLDFRRLVVEEERRRHAELPIDSLIALAALRELKRVTAEELAERIQRDAASAKRTLEALTEAGLVEAHGATRARSYTLSASIYRAIGDQAAYTRQLGFSAIQHEQMVLNYMRQHGQIKRAEVMELCRLSTDQAAKLLKKLKTDGAIVQHGKNRGAVYTSSSSRE